jgi:glycosyltransferase involved in cell wall biosynthesis
MRVAYAYEFSADDIEVRSGHPHFMLRELEKRTRVGKVFPLDRRRRYVFAPKLIYHRALGQTYLPDREPLLLKSYAQQVTRQLSRDKPDCLFSPSSTITSFLDADLPKVFCADATFANVLDAYDEYRNCAGGYVRQAHAQESRALATCAAAIYPSEWAARSAVDDYGADPAKVHVLPFGANVHVPPPDAVARAIERRSFDPLRILFVGRDWWRKGGDVVLRACEIAVRNGARLQLDLVGIDHAPEPLPPFVVRHGNLAKSDPEQRRRFEELLAQAHLLFVPSRAENYGIAFSEAAAYGVSSLSSDAGGIPTVVRPGVSGFTLPAESGPEVFAQTMMEIVSDRAGYDALAWSARCFHDRRLSWDLFGERLVRILRQVTQRTIAYDAA